VVLDLVLRGATVVTPGHAEAADIGIAGGRIAQLGGTMSGTRELAAGGLLAIPGGVDAHTHLMHQGLGDRLEPPIWVDDFWSGSRAAITGGVTTIGNMTFPVPRPGTRPAPGGGCDRWCGSGRWGAQLPPVRPPVRPAGRPPGRPSARPSVRRAG
jgi:hypothetical protein